MPSDDSSKPQETDPRFIRFLADVLAFGISIADLPTVRLHLRPEPIQFTGVIELVEVEPFCLTRRTVVSWN